MSKKAEILPPEKAEQIREGADLQKEEWNDTTLASAWKMVPDQAGVGEMIQFLRIADQYKLDPFLGEIYLAHTKQGLQPVTGRDTFIRIAERYEDYRGINSGVVYENDEFKSTKKESEDGVKVIVEHTITSISGRGDIEGAYCVAKRDGHDDVLVVRAWEDYDHLHYKDNWDNYGEDMIETRCITAALRRQFPITGLYVESEFEDGKETKKDRENVEEINEHLENEEDFKDKAINELQERTADNVEVIDGSPSAGGNKEDTEDESEQEEDLEDPSKLTDDDTVEDVKKKVREGFVSPSDALSWEKDNKERKTLLSWLDSYIENLEEEIQESEELEELLNERNVDIDLFLEWFQESKTLPDCQSLIEIPESLKDIILEKPDKMEHKFRLWQIEENKGDLEFVSDRSMELDDRMDQE